MPLPERRGNAQARSDEVAARKRLAALVSGGLHFKVKRDGERIFGARHSGGAKLWARLSSKTFAPEQTIDLRGRSEDEIGAAISAALPVLHRRGIKHVLIPFAESSTDPLREAGANVAIKALTLGTAAPLVRAFASAHESLGGAAVLAVLLI